MSARAVLAAHLAAWHPRISVSSHDTAATLGRKHADAHWRFGNLTHRHEGYDDGARHRPPGWRTGEGVIPRTAHGGPS